MRISKEELSNFNLVKWNKKPKSSMLRLLLQHMASTVGLAVITGLIAWAGKFYEPVGHECIREIIDKLG